MSEALLNVPIQKFDFVQLVRLLENLYERSKLMQFHAPVQLRPSNTFVFPSSDVFSLEQHEDRITIEINFMGLYGHSSPLPSYITLPILQEGEEFVALKKLLDIFNHRFYMLYYRAHTFSHPLFFHNTLRKKILGFSGTTLRGRNSASALENHLKSQFGFTQVSVHQFFPIKERLDDEYRTLGKIRLGAGAIIGKYFSNAGNGIQVCIGDLSLNEFYSFYENNRTKMKELLEFIRSSVSQPLCIQLKLIQNLDHVNHKSFPTRLHQETLGIDTWLGKKARIPHYITLTS